MMTTLRFEVWASDNGESTHWKLLRGGVWESEKPAVEMAENMRRFNQKVCVEKWDAGRNVYLETTWEA